METMIIESRLFCYLFFVTYFLFKKKRAIRVAARANRQPAKR